MDLLDAGIDVITTVNVAHLDCIADAVQRIIEVPVRERVPDWVLRKASQIELVGSSPEQLRRRMLHGNIYSGETAREALTHYFQADRLTALRELALRFLADDTEEQLLGYLRRRQEGAVWETYEGSWSESPRPRERTPSCAGRQRMANRIKADREVLHVKSGRDVSRFPGDQLTALRHSVADAGAEWNEIRGDGPAQALRFCPAPARHPDRNRLDRAESMERADGWGLYRLEDLTTGRSCRHRRPHHRPSEYRTEIRCSR